MASELPIPSHFHPEKVNAVWRVPYQQRAEEAEIWAKKHALKPASRDEFRIALKLVDCQNTFCLPEFELFVAGRSGNGAVEDSVRLCEFIYRNLNHITQIVATMDTHMAMQIFHPLFWIDTKGAHPAPHTVISVRAIESGKWAVNPNVDPYASHRGLEYLQQYVLHYVKTLEKSSKYPLTIWPYHAMLGSISHALVSSIEEACFYHTVARKSQTRYEVKGRNPLTEHYSVLCPEVLADHEGHPIAEKNLDLIEDLLCYDMLIIAGQAKSHCLAWSVANLLDEIKQRNPKLAEKVYLLEDCTSPVVVPGVVDYTDQADSTFKRFSDSGVHIVKSTRAMTDWPGIAKEIKR